MAMLCQTLKTKGLAGDAYALGLAAVAASSDSNPAPVPISNTRIPGVTSRAIAWE